MIKPDFCELWVVRHGQTAANKNKILQGHLDTDLDASGLLQAEAVAKRLKNVTFDAVFSSDLKRARDTAEQIIKYHPELKLVTHPELRERYFGTLQGKTYSELQEKYPDVMESLKKDEDQLNIPGGESIQECN